jgi:hypothetical protein
MRRVKFIPLEDARLKELVSLFGESDWASIANRMPYRTVRQCRERWMYFLTPSIKNGPWSAAEDALLLKKFGDMGSQWKWMTQFFPGRTEVNIKNHYAVLLRRRAAFPDTSSSEPLYQVELPAPRPAVELVASRRNANIGSEEFVADRFKQLSSLVWDGQTEEELSDSGAGPPDMEYSLQSVFL